MSLPRDVYQNGKSQLFKLSCSNTVSKYTDEVCIPSEQCSLLWKALESEMHIFFYFSEKSVTKVMWLLLLACNDTFITCNGVMMLICIGYYGIRWQLTEHCSYEWVYPKMVLQLKICQPPENIQENIINQYFNTIVSFKSNHYHT